MPQIDLLSYFIVSLIKTICESLKGKKFCDFYFYKGKKIIKSISPMFFLFLENKNKMRISEKNTNLNYLGNDTAIFLLNFNIFSFLRNWSIKNIFISSFLFLILLCLLSYLRNGCMPNFLIAIPYSLIIYGIFQYIKGLSYFPHLFKRYQAMVERRLISLLMGENDENPIKKLFKAYLWIYLFLLLMVRYFYCWLTDNSIKLAIFSTLSIYSIITIINQCENPYIVALTFMFPFFFILMDIRSSAVASFFNKNPYLFTKLLNSPFLNDYGVNNNMGGEDPKQKGGGGKGV
jgi:hypothetical protein